MLCSEADVWAHTYTSTRTHTHEQNALSGCVMGVWKAAKQFIFRYISWTGSGSFHWFISSHLYVAFFPDVPQSSSGLIWACGHTKVWLSSLRSHTPCSVPHVCALFASGRRFLWVLSNRAEQSLCLPLPLMSSAHSPSSHTPKLCRRVGERVATLLPFSWFKMWLMLVWRIHVLVVVSV